jgi:membrane protease YdiL (CAAX protease family)
MLRFIDHRPLKSIGFSFSHFFRDLSAGLVIGVAWIGVSIGFALLFGFILPVAPVGFSWYVLAGLSISMLFNVVTQELLLCGFILQTVRNQSNTVIAIIVSSFLFASYHAGAFKGEWLPVVNVFAAGVLFCIAYIITNNLWFPIFIHFAWDVLLGPVFGLTESGITNLGGGWKMFQLKGPSLFTGGSFGMEGGLIVTFTVILIISLLYYYHSKKITPYSRPQII